VLLQPLQDNGLAAIKKSSLFLCRVLPWLLLQKLTASSTILKSLGSHLVANS
jgi:hypothetical protein